MTLNPRPEPERAAVRSVLNSESFADAAPAAVYHTLLDEGTYLAEQAQRP